MNAKRARQNPWPPTQRELRAYVRELDLEEEQRRKRAHDVRPKHHRGEPRRYQVSWYAPTVGRRVTYDRLVRATNKQDAIREVRAWLRSRAFREHKGVANFIAREVKSNPMAKGKKTTSKSKSRKAANPRAAAAKRNFLGFGKAAKRRRKKRAKVAAAKAHLVAAKAELAMAQANPKRPKKWLGKLGLKKGALHRALGIPEGQKIPISTLIQAAESGARKLGARARFALVRQGYRKREGKWVLANPARGRRQKSRKNGLLKREFEYLVKTKKGGPSAGLIKARSPKAAVAALRRAYKDQEVKSVRVWKLKAARNPMHPLEIGSHVANMLLGVKTVRELTRKPAKKRNPQKANPNTPSLQRIYREFRGRENNGQTFAGYTPAGTPKDVAMLGRLNHVRLASGQVISFRRRNPALLGAAQRGQVRRLYIVLQRPYAMPNGANGKALNYGPVDEIEYKTDKPHLYPTTRCIDFYHEMGEEGGRKPVLILQNGVLDLRGGDYKIKREGIRN